MTLSKIINETAAVPSVQQNSTKVPAPTTLSIVEMIKRRDKAATEVATYQRMIDREALRLTKEEENKQRWKTENWTAQYKGQAGRILSAIRCAPKRRLSTGKIEIAGWGKAKNMVSRNTLKSALTRIRKKLKEDKCPYMLTSIRSSKTGEVIGYGLRQYRKV